ncbi:putative PAS domain protein [Nitrospina gracilis 3/211]|uniref:Sensory/regulatory protein RpfC n=1 Tax=Nitrospina gracilis (strain 3/211) TaxID=1266370 RepID=M1YGV8_NITG3|nr:MULTISPECIES: PAS domain S-box protein [Nitrospina]MCF8722702.1 PAS domain S-box-containing protein [Nitrospina sp. Nb-3]CCQ89644.1 putative PAS domain protein [Nitrospina gracilis 3/211]
MVFPPIPKDTLFITGFYDYGLVILSYLVAAFASYIVLDMMTRFHQNHTHPKLLLFCSAISMGGGIWSMHFVAMLAYEMPVSVTYDPWITALSLLIPILFSGIAFQIFHRAKSIRSRVLGGGLILGLGIDTMHYCGMAGMIFNGTLHYKLSLFLLSGLVAVTVATVAFYAIVKIQTQQISHGFILKVATALLLGFAVAGMHYTGMAATLFVPSSGLETSQQFFFSPENLAYAIVMVTVLNLTLAMFIAQNLILGPIVSFLCVFFIGWLGIQLVEREIKMDLATILQEYLKINVESVESFIERELTNVDFWSKTPQVKELVTSLALKVDNGTTSPQSLMKSPELKELRKILGPFNKKQNHIGFVVIHPSGLTMAALLNEPVGNSYLKEKEFIQRSLKGEVIFSPPFWAEVQLPDPDGIYRRNQPTLFASAPVHDAEGRPIAVLGFRLRPRLSFEDVLETTYSGETGESYAFNKEGIMIGGGRFANHLRQVGLIPPEPSPWSLKLRIRDPGGNMVKGFRPSIPREKQPFTRMVERALSGQSGVDVGGYRDYRGVPVVGAWTWLPKYGFGIAREMDWDEAYKSLRMLRKIYYSLLIVLFVVVVTTLVFRRKQVEARVERKKAQKGIQKAQEEAEKFRQLFLAESDAILIFDAETRSIIDANQSVEKLYGYSRQELLQMKAETLSADPEGTLSTFQQLVEGRVTEVTLRYHKKKDGTVFPVEVMEGIISTLEGRIVFKVVRDITRRMQAEKALRESEERFSLAMDASQDGLWDCNLVTGDNYFSPAWLFMLGYRQGELEEHMSTFFDELMHPEDRDRYTPEIMQHLQSKDSNFEVELRLRHKDGGYRWILTRGKTVERDENGRAVRAVGTHTDITERKQAEEALRQSEKRFELTMYATQDGLWDWSIKTGDVYYSPHWLSMLGYAPGELPHEPSTFFNLLHPEDVEKYSDLIQKHLEESDENFEFELRLRHKDGSYRWIMDRGRTVERDESGNAVRALGTHTDITNRKRIEEQLRQAEHEAIAANEAKSRFLANMSHEIRTPMNAILGMAYLCLKTELTSKQKEYLEGMQRSARNLLGIINDILDFSKIEAGKLSLESIPFDLAEVLETIASQESLRAFNQGTELVFFNSQAIPSKLTGDPLRLGQVLTNLINNAIKFTIKGTVAVFVELEKLENNRVFVKFAVQDTGVGMDGEQIRSLFQAFEQADPSTTRRFGGTGLGLAISSQLVELMGGKLEVESKPNEGSRFTFVIPFLSSQENHPRITIPYELYEKRALIVAGNKMVAEIVKDMLGSVGIQSKTSVSLEEAAVRFKETGPENPLDLILLDINLTQLNWFDVCENLKKEVPQPEPPKIILLAPKELNVSDSADSRNPIDAVVFKPICLSQLFDAIMDLYFGKQLPVRKQRKWNSVVFDTVEEFKEMKVLIAEDNQVNQVIAKELMEKLGFKVTLAENGREALQILDQSGFDLVLMDIQMPVMDGFEATRKIREQERFKDMPVIALTANAMAGDRERTRAAGMNDHVTKPIDPDVLLGTLKHWLRKETKISNEMNVPEELLQESEPSREKLRPSGGGPKTGLQSDAATMEILDLPGINVEEGLRRIGGNLDIYVDVLKACFTDFIKDREDIETALKNQDREMLKMKVHSIKGVSGNIGAKDLFQCASNLEIATREKSEEEIEKCLQKFWKSFDQVFNGLEVLNNKTGPPEDSSGGKSQPEIAYDPNLNALFNNIYTLLMEKDRRAFDRIKVLKNYFDENAFREEWQALIKYVTHFNFEDAIEVLKRIQGKLNVN